MRSTIVAILSVAVLVGAGAASAAPSARSIRAAVAETNRVAERTGSKWSLVVDRPGFGAVGYGRDRETKSNSLVKAVALLAYTRRHAGRRLAPAERDRLSRMIRRSDNAAATDTIRRVGLARMRAAARRAGMRRFSPVAPPFWGASRLTAAGSARFMLDLRAALPARHREWAYLLLRDIVPSQRWGIPEVAPAGAVVHFKAGWDGRGHVIQAARIACGRERIGLAVVADSDGQARSIARVRALARRALAPWRGRCR